MCLNYRVMTLSTLSHPWWGDFMVKNIEAITHFGDSPKTKIIVLTDDFARDDLFVRELHRSLTLKVKWHVLDVTNYKDPHDDLVTDVKDFTPTNLIMACDYQSPSIIDILQKFKAANMIDDASTLYSTLIPSKCLLLELINIFTQEPYLLMSNTVTTGNGVALTFKKLAKKKR